MSVCVACNKFLTDKEMAIDFDYCLNCINISNEARIELEQGKIFKRHEITASFKNKKFLDDL